MPELLEDTHYQEDGLLATAQWVPGPFTQRLQSIHPSTEFPVPTSYQGWRDVKGKDGSSKRPTCRMGNSLLASRAAQQMQGSWARVVAAGRLRAPALESDLCSSNPNFVLYVWPRASNIPHSTPHLAAVLRGQLDKLTCPAREGQLWCYVPSIALAYISVRCLITTTMSVQTMSSFSGKILLG